MKRVKKLFIGSLVRCVKLEKPVFEVFLCNVVLMPSKNKVSCELRQWCLILREDFVSRSIEGGKRTEVKMDILLSKRSTVMHCRRSEIA